MVIGSGILTMPYTMRRMGYIFGILVFIIGVSLNQFGTVMLLKAKNLSRHSNYTTIFHAIWASRISKGIASMVIFLSCSGVCKQIFNYRYCRPDFFQDYSPQANFWFHGVGLWVGSFLCKLVLYCRSHIDPRSTIHNGI